MSFKTWDAEKRSKSDELLRRGKYRHLLLPHQREFRDMVEEGTGNHYGLYTGRKFGKSFTLAIMAMEFAHNNPGSIQRIVLPSKVQAKEIYFNIFQELQDIIPLDLMPNMLKMESCAVFKNGAKISFNGSLPENIESARGPIAHRIYRDECAAFNANNYEYATYSVLLPQMTTIANAKLIDATTPPKSPAHPWIQSDFPRLLSKNALKRFTINDNKLLTPEMLANIIEQYGGVDNENYRREHLCELVSDGNLRIAPEFNIKQHVGEVDVCDSFGNPVIWQPIIASDLGLVDFSFHVFGYYHASLDKYIVVDEWRQNYKTFDVIVDAYNKGVERNFPKHEWLEPDSICDVWPIAQFELRNNHNWNMRPPVKGRVEEQVAFLRDCLVNDKVLISSKCINLINDLTMGIWSPNRKEFDRGGNVGHSDGIAALCYALKSVPWAGTKATPNLKFGGIRGAKKK